MATTKNLTKRTIESIRIPAQGSETYTDHKDNYLKLVVTPSTRTWRYVRKWNGQVLFLTLGRYPDVTPDQARAAARLASADIARGLDPRDKKRRARKAGTWSDLFSWYIKDHAKPNKRTWKGDEEQNRLYCAAWKGRKLDSITKDFIRRWHRGISQNKGKIAADRALALVKCVFNRAMDADLFEGNNPASGVAMNYKGAKRYSRNRFLNADELKRLFSVLDEHPNQDLADFFRLAILTGARRGNVQSMRWADFDRAANTWTIPAEQSKNKEPMEVPILPPAAEILNRRWEKRKSDVYVFPSRRSKAKTPHMSSPKAAWAVICEKAELKGVRIHDLRRTMGSWMAESGASLLVIGKALGHQDSKTTQIYAHLGSDPVRVGMGAAVNRMLEAVNGDGKEGEK
jgi:integrase